MTLAAVEPRILITGTGTLGPFSLTVSGSPLRFTSNSHIRVTRYSAAGVGTLLVEGTDYTLTGGPNAGSLLLTSPQTVLLNTEQLLVERAQPFVQDLALGNGVGFPSVSVEARLDKLTEFVQDLSARVGRAVTAHPTDPFSYALAAPADRALKYPYYDASGNLTTAAGPAGSGTVPVSIALQPVVAASTTDEALARLNGAVEVANITALRAKTWTGSGRPDLVVLISSYVAGDGGGVFRWESASVVTDDNGITIKETATTTGRWLRQFTGPVNVRWFGARGDGTTNDTTAVQNAIDYIATLGSGAVYFPRGTYDCATLTWKTGVWGVGDGGFLVSTIRLRNGTNADLILGQNAVSLWAGSTDGGLSNYGFTGVTLNGNRANNTTGNCLRIFGRAPRFRDFYVTEAPEIGIWHRWGTPATNYPFGGEAIFSNVYVYNTGKEGIYFEGPNDSQFTDVFVVNASQLGDNLYDAIWVTKNVRMRAVHAWRYDPPSFGTKVARTAIRVDANGCDFSGCHFEGMWTACLQINTQFNTFADDNKFYAAHNGVTVQLNASYNTLKGNLLGPATATACKGVVLASSASYNLIELNAVEQQAGVIDWTGTGGNNRVVMRGINTGGVFMVGSPATTDMTDIRIAGVGGGISAQNPIGLRLPSSASITNYPLQINTTSGVNAAGATQGTATGLDSGIVLHNVTVVAASTGVRLPISSRGAKFTVVNQGANTLNIYPATGEAIGTAAVNTPITLAVNKAAEFTCIVTGFWAVVVGA